MQATRNIVMTTVLIAMIFPTYAFGQSAKEAILALKKLQVKVQTGITYKEYSPAVAEAKFPVIVFLESPEGKLDTALSAYLSKAVRHYDNAISVWGIKFSSRRVESRIYADKNRELFEAVIRMYPDSPVNVTGYTKQSYIDIGEMLSFIWTKASIELEKASGLLAQVESNAKALKLEGQLLQKENEQLKAEITVMRTEIERLKVENKKLQQEVDTLKSKPTSQKKAKQ
ncbi:MAG: hypothetical protein AB1401_06065 [Thermodesulfobacteriota bacterium]